VAWGERGIEEDKALGILNGARSGEEELRAARPRVPHARARACRQYQIQEFELADAVAGRGARPTARREPRYLGRVALARLLAGDFTHAVKARASDRVVREGQAGRRSVVALFDAALLVESGLPERALEVLGTLDSTRAHIVRATALHRSRAQALYDQGALDQALSARRRTRRRPRSDGAANNAEAKALVALDHVRHDVAAKRANRRGQAPLNDVANSLRSQARPPHRGCGAVARRRSRCAQAARAGARGDLGVEPAPDPYRTHTLLARPRSRGRRSSRRRSPHADSALQSNGNYLPAMVVTARTLLESGDAGGRPRVITPVLGAKVDHRGRRREGHRRREC
jgi:hypothetical protein